MKIRCIIILVILGIVTKGKCIDYREASGCRANVVNLKQYGGVGDGVTSNTLAFNAAVDDLRRDAAKGGGMLYVPSGKWLTGPFYVTSHFTLFLEHGAELLATTNEKEWPVIDALPSYGKGRDATEKRYANFIMGTNLTDVVITGNNGTINGQGQMWWDKFHKKQLNHTRGYLIELMYSHQILISNLTLVNSPAWNIHPVYSTDVVIQNITILAPATSPNTDGINPDSCSGVRIEDCYIVSGDDCIAIKSGWDEYGIKVGMPSEHIIIRRLTCIHGHAAIALGSEMSGGIHDVRAEDITAINTGSGVRIKTAIGRGNYVKDIYVRRMKLYTMKYVFWMTGSYGGHPDDQWDRNAIPEVTNINYNDVVATNVTIAGKLEGIDEHPFTNICISNVNAQMFNSKSKKIWNCTDIQGVSSNVQPTPCHALPSKAINTSCPFPSDRLPIEDLRFHTCK